MTNYYITPLHPARFLHFQLVDREYNSRNIMSLRSLKVFKGLFYFFYIMGIYAFFLWAFQCPMPPLCYHCIIWFVFVGVVWFGIPLSGSYADLFFWCLYIVFFIYREIVSFHLVKLLTIAAWIFGVFISSFYGSFWRSFLQSFYIPFI